MSKADDIFNECYLSALEALTPAEDDPHERHLLADGIAENFKEKLKKLLPKPCVAVGRVVSILPFPPATKMACGGTHIGDEFIFCPKCGGEIVPEPSKKPQ